MAQRRRPAPSPAEAPLLVVDAGDVAARQGSIPSPAATTAHLGPAPQHPLYPSASPSRPSFTLSQTARQQRQKWASTGGDVDDKYDGRRKMSTMDRLEGWFGLVPDVDSSSSSSSAAPLTSTLRPPSPSVAQRQRRPSKSTQLVLVHAVALNDTLEGIAIRYSTDVRTLRRVNKLWPGDSVQVRKELFVPFKEDAVQEQAQPGGHSDTTKLGLFPNGIADVQHTRSLSVVSTSSSSEATSSISRAALSEPAELDGRPSFHSPELRRIALHTLSYFPPPGTAPTTSDKGKEKQDALRPEELLDPGESGVDDLLQLAERARLRGSSQGSPPASPLRHLESLAPVYTNGRAPSEGNGSTLDDRTAFSSPATSSRALNDDEWKPNKYTLGQRRRQNLPSPQQPQPLSMSATDAASTPQQGPAMMVASTSDLRTGEYQGWNDIPEPPLSRTAQGKVAHAYKPKRRYPRPGVSDGSVAGSALIEDLAAGLPPNPGPAANWARPIGDCLPVPLDGSRAGDRRTSSSHSQGLLSSNWGQILSDTVRGKIRLEDALERGLEDIRAGFSSTATTLSADAPAPRLRTNGRLRPAMSAQHLTETYVAQRPSAEMARVALAGSAASSTLDGGGGTASNPAQSSSTTLLGPDQSGGATLRRSSGRSLHELEDLRVQSAAGPLNGVSSTWSAASNGPSMDAAAAGGVRGRRNVRNVDWLG